MGWGRGILCREGVYLAVSNVGFVHLVCVMLKKQPLLES